MARKFIFILFFFCIAVTCSKAKVQSEKSEETTPAASSREARKEDIAIDKDSEVEDNLRQEKKTDSNISLGKIFFPTMESRDRFLEYSISLSYDCKDLLLARKEMLNLIPKYGFLESSTASSSNSRYMTTRITVRSRQLYEVLQELDKLGRLTNENITSIDHTDNLVAQNRKSAREKKRIARKNIASRQITSESKNWEAIDRSLTQSEDAEDQSEHEIWRVHDKISWTKIILTLSLPEAPPGIKIPDYRNAFVGMTNLMLNVTYYLVWFLPIIVILGAMGYYGKKLYKRFLR